MRQLPEPGSSSPVPTADNAGSPFGKGSGFLSDYTKALNASADRSERERQEWQASLGEPAYSIDCGDYVLSFFKTDEGAMMCQKRKNGYHWKDAQYFHRAVIQVLALVSGDLPESGSESLELSPPNGAGETSTNKENPA